MSIIVYQVKVPYLAMQASLCHQMADAKTEAQYVQTFLIVRVL